MPYTLYKVQLQSLTDKLCQQHVKQCRWRRQSRDKSRNTRRIKCEATWQCLPQDYSKYLSKRSDKGWETDTSRPFTNHWARDKLSAVYTGLRAEMGRLSDSIRSTASTIPVWRPHLPRLSQIWGDLLLAQGSHAALDALYLVWLTRPTYYHTEQVCRYFVLSESALGPMHTGDDYSTRESHKYRAE